MDKEWNDRKLDEKIQKALENRLVEAIQSEGGKGNRFDEESITELISNSFKSKMKWAIVIMWSKLIFSVLISIISVGMFLISETTRAQIAWSTMFIIGVAGVGIMSALYWMEVNRHSITRDLKRLELMVAKLVEAQS